ncbi:MAG: hypothetical protein IIC94_06280 [Chloroflexi bacterium]|nr:hypothetical protein [Chloroflexota bacterium]
MKTPLSVVLEKRPHALSALVLLAAVVTACAPPEPAPTATPSIEAPEPAPTATPTPTTALTPPAAPPETPAPTPTRTPTAVPTPTSLPTPTIEPCKAPYDATVVSGPSGPSADGADGDRVFRSLAVHPNDADTVILGTERNGFVRSTDGGVTWTRLRAGLRSGFSYPEIWDIAYAPSDPSVLMAATLDSPGPTTGAPQTAGAGVYRSTDGGESWRQVNCGFPTSRVNSVRLDPTDPLIAVAGLEGGVPSFTGVSGIASYYEGGLYRTVDGGESWYRVPLGPNDGRNGYLVMETVPEQPATIITFAMNQQDLGQNLGFARSTDSGATWELFADELRYKPITSFAVSGDGQVIYANEDGTYFGWVSRDAGATWTQSAIVQVNGPIAVSPADPNLVIFSAHDALRRSTDGLRTVQTVVAAPQVEALGGLSPFRQIEFAPSDPSIVYAEADGYLLYRSDDAGATWRLVANVRADVLNAVP